jgi:hypothetical protein
MNIDNIIFKISNNGLKYGNIFFQNNYGLFVSQYGGSSTYGMSLIGKLNEGNKTPYIDDNLISIHQRCSEGNLSEEEINTYITLVENLPNN